MVKINWNVRECRIRDVNQLALPPHKLNNVTSKRTTPGTPGTEVQSEGICSTNEPLSSYLLTFNYNYGNMTMVKEVRMQIAAGEFKAKCLQLMDKVNIHAEEIVITKHGKPVAKLVPIDQKPKRPCFGYMKKSVHITGDIVAPIDETWEAER